MMDSPVGVPTGAPVTGLWLRAQPNPFHASTLVRFALPRASVVSLVITDIAGRVIERPLAAQALAAGEHAVTFRARDLPAGLYLFTLRGEGFAETRKLVLAP